GLSAELQVAKLMEQIRANNAAEQQRGNRFMPSSPGHIFGAGFGVRGGCWEGRDGRGRPYYGLGGARRTWTSVLQFGWCETDVDVRPTVWGGMWARLPSSWARRLEVGCGWPLYWRKPSPKEIPASAPLAWLQRRQASRYSSIPCCLLSHSR
ncbi:MAG: hypothetical protein RLZZ458_2209, partial [Planctomycetota bacterium]